MSEELKQALDAMQYIREHHILQTKHKAGVETAIAALQAALSQPTQPAQVGWQPISTAPEDMPECVVVRWVDSEGNECRDLDYMEDGCWMRWHDRAEHVEMIGGHGASYTPPYVEWLVLPPTALNGGKA